MRGRMLTALAVVLSLYLAYGVAMVWMHRAFLYPFFPDPADLPGFERIEVAVPGADPVGVLAGGPIDGLPVLFFMGNAGSLAHFEPWLRLHADAGQRVVAMTYRGGGGEPGWPTEARLKADALAVHDWLAGQGSPVALHGFSLGSGLAMHVAARREVRAVLLEAPFASICRLMTRAARLPACWLPVDRWDSVADAEGVSAPVVILHGDVDEAIPLAEGRRLAETLGSGKHPPAFEPIEGGRHGDLPDFAAYRAAVGRFAGQAP